jgi:hypothetical protein
MEHNLEKLIVIEQVTSYRISQAGRRSKMLQKFSYLQHFRHVLPVLSSLGHGLRIIGCEALFSLDFVLNGYPLLKRTQSVFDPWADAETDIIHGVSRDIAAQVVGSAMILTRTSAC